MRLEVMIASLARDDRFSTYERERHFVPLFRRKERRMIRIRCRLGHRQRGKNKATDGDFR